MNLVGAVFMLAGYSSRFDLDDKFLLTINLY
jgi:CTP:molybdopterin cytidylyltransferase MocA